MTDLQSRIEGIRGKRLEKLGLACEMMTFVFEVFVSNGYSHFGEESEQWRFFEKEKTDLPDMVVYGKSVEMG